MAGVGVIAAMVGEARRLGVSGARVIHSGIGPARAADAARGLLAEECHALVSAGIAGGLDPTLEAGVVVVPDWVAAPDGRRFECDRPWRVVVRDLLDGRGGGIVGSATVVGDVAAKRALFAAGAAAVDMESHAVAEVAAEAGVPFIAVRVVADTAEMALPEWALDTVDSNGRLQVGRAVAAVAFAPWRIATALRLAAASRDAYDALGRVAAILGEGFGFR